MDKDDQSESNSPLSGTAKEMLDQSQEFTTKASRKYSGDGTWIESHLLFALVEAQTGATAASKAAAALENRDGRPDPLFAHDAEDTYELLAALDAIPLTAQGTPWERADPIAQVETRDDELVQYMCAVAPFEEESDAAVVSEWGETIRSLGEFGHELGSFSEQGWLVAGLGLAPLGAGEGNDKYIGNTYEVYCPECNSPQQAECINVTYDKDAGMDAGVWVCQNCDADYRGTHPRGPAKLSRRDPKP